MLTLYILIFSFFRCSSLKKIFGEFEWIIMENSPYFPQNIS